MNAPIIAASPMPNRRTGERYASVLMVGRADLGGRELLCLIHNISARGLMARFAVPPAVGREIVIECRGLPPTPAVVRWRHGERAGLEFRTPPDAPQSATGGRMDDAPRTPRFTVALAATIERDDVTWGATICDISIGGACAASTAPAHVGDVVRLSLPDAGITLSTRVVWRDDGRVGLRFLHRLALPQLATLLAQ